MIKFFFPFLVIFLGSIQHAEGTRHEITQIKKQKQALNLEQKRLLKEAKTTEEMIKTLSNISAEKKEKLLEHQEEISKTLPLLARLERANPLRLLIDSTTGQHKVRSLVLMRFFLSTIKRKMQNVQTDLNELIVMANDLELKNQKNHQFLQEVERQRMQLSSLENVTIENWTKAEIDRLAKEKDINTLLDESRSILSKPKMTASAAAALKGLPFRRLEPPVGGKIVKDSALQNKFSPHSQGIFFETQKSVQVCAPAKGRIVFRGPFRTHSEILIIDHGQKAHTILMGIHKIDADVGKTVYAGEKLGMMAGYGSGPLYLYLELRHRGKSIDPRPYFAIKNLE